MYMSINTQCFVHLYKLTHTWIYKQCFTQLPYLGKCAKHCFDAYVNKYTVFYIFVHIDTYINIQIVFHIFSKIWKIGETLFGCICQQIHSLHICIYWHIYEYINSVLYISYILGNVHHILFIVISFIGGTGRQYDVYHTNPVPSEMHGTEVLLTLQSLEYEQPILSSVWWASFHGRAAEW